jgi:hypothetical protein
VNFRMEVGQFTESLLVSGMVPMEPRIVALPSSSDPEPEPDIRSRRLRANVAVPQESVRKLEIPVTVSAGQERTRVIEPPSPPDLTFAPATLELPPLPPGQIEVPNVIAAVEPARPSPLKRAFSWVIPDRNKGITPAKPVKQVQPRLVVRETVSVSVQVVVDDKGIVRDAVLLTKDVDGHVGRSATAAAKRWIFEPARSEAGPVSSELVVRFQFAGEPDAPSRPLSASQGSSARVPSAAGSLTPVRTDRQLP